MIFLKKNIIFAFLSIFVFFLFYDLSWGAPFYFHPDERNIALSVSQLHLFNNLNPHFFAYGSLPIYAIYFSGLILNFLESPFAFNNFTVGFEHAIIIGRIFSASFTILTLYLIFEFTKKLADKITARAALLFGSTSIAFLQYSHFATFEMWLSFFYLLLIYLLYLFLTRGGLKYFVLASITLGVAISIKVSSLVLISIPLLVIAKKVLDEKPLIKKTQILTRLTSILIYFPFLTYLLTNPYVFIDTKSFIDSINYEASVALGTLPVFYTGVFYNTTPILFQYLKTLPFLLNPLITALSLPAILAVFYFALKKKDIYVLLLLLSLTIIFASQSVLFTKWTRYVVPSASFFYIVIALFLFNVKNLLPGKAWNISVIAIFIVALLFSFSFIKTVRLTPDPRIAGANFAKKNIQSESKVVSEVYDMGIVPFNNHLRNITLFNFYELDNGPSKIEELYKLLESTDYIILPSQRILRSRIINKERFPRGFNFYSNLLSEKSGFKKIYETPCDIFCKLLYIGDPIFNVEETVNIFDRPSLFIFKKNKQNFQFPISNFQ